MSLPRVPAAAVVAGEALDRADTKNELEAIWLSTGCNAFRGAARQYLMGIYKRVCARIDSGSAWLKYARAM
jgi:hypothetical protein